ncbi:hypothetical protein [Pleurocapsa sp. FMAR1]|uniref:hypothetical protein n=1 Tax=Pleurocapsa sp. FMAR1 TaxID=3040204 RepID=UPI0029C638E9|nr:hypothetical protein [Pleurocapsa sp. FMAR1]
MNPNNWFTVFSFCAIATFLSVSYGWLVKKGKLPLNSVMAFNDAQIQFIRVWAKVAGLVGIILPLVMWIVFWNQPIVRVFFSCYLLAVVVQLASETGFSRILCKSVVVIIGTLYTGFRIWQLWSGLHLINYPQPWLGLLWLVLLFWVANLIMLTTMAIPSIFPKSESYSLGETKTD